MIYRYKAKVKYYRMIEDAHLNYYVYFRYFDLSGFDLVIFISRKQKNQIGDGHLIHYVFWGH